MKFLILLITLLIPAAAQAQQATQLPKEVTLRLTSEQFSYIYGQLQERPFKEVAELLMNLRTQAMQQMPPPPVAEKKD